MKKLVKIATALTLMGGIFVSANGVSANTDVVQKSSPDIMIKFDDVTTDHWAYDEITNLVYHRIMYGYGNGKFGTEDNITREQAAAVLYRALGLKRSAFNENPYGDISGKSTMFPYEILHLTKIGIFKGDENGNFRPKDTLTRGELAQVLTKAYELKTKRPHTFTDIPENYWARDAISALQSNKVAVGTGDGKFQPEMLVTRGQFAKFLQRSIDNSPGKME
ncbi:MULTISPECIES: S-layer homology domain-containing protein [Bacillus]|uniref:S-layer homology domain-containing protein n=1 Tax=Bacillus TaxID=1386 RepID=UPI0002F098C4|nr:MULTISPECIES: S-layer homology domain-containing protein [Bacillus]MCU4897930.1 S-layer homology domain-containing protein [Bacillus cereus]MCU5483624.1 S-layer homology domain-containing protein [Bacillus cereus]MEC4693558.1 S-layer homology domain-containing protein [Bacillus anthracis]PRQ01362.1 S-layer protein sap precursor [Bacillus sp. M21]